MGITGVFPELPVKHLEDMAKICQMGKIFFLKIVYMLRLQLDISIHTYVYINVCVKQTTDIQKYLQYIKILTVSIFWRDVKQQIFFSVNPGNQCEVSYTVCIFDSDSIDIRSQKLCSDLLAYALEEESLRTNHQTTLCLLHAAHCGMNGKESNGTIIIKDCCLVLMVSIFHPCDLGMNK